MIRRAYTALVTPATQHRLAGVYLDAIAALDGDPRLLVVQRLGLGHIATLLLLEDLGVERVVIADDLPRSEAEIQFWIETCRVLGVTPERVEVRECNARAWNAFVREHAVTSEDLENE